MVRRRGALTTAMCGECIPKQSTVRFRGTARSVPQHSVPTHSVRIAHLGRRTVMRVGRQGFFNGLRLVDLRIGFACRGVDKQSKEM